MNYYPSLLKLMSLRNIDSILGFNPENDERRFLILDVKKKDPGSDSGSGFSIYDINNKTTDFISFNLNAIKISEEDIRYNIEQLTDKINNLHQLMDILKELKVEKIDVGDLLIYQLCESFNKKGITVKDKIEAIRRLQSI